MNWHSSFQREGPQKHHLMLLIMRQKFSFCFMSLVFQQVEELQTSDRLPEDWDAAKPRMIAFLISSFV